MKDYIFTASSVHTPKKTELCLEDAENNTAFYTERSGTIDEDLQKLGDKLKTFTDKNPTSNFKIINYEKGFEITKVPDEKQEKLVFELRKAFPEESIFQLWQVINGIYE